MKATKTRPEFPDKLPFLPGN